MSSSMATVPLPPMPRPPVAETTRARYTKERIETGMNYATQAIAQDSKRNFSGVSRLGLNAYRNTCEAALTSDWPPNQAVIDDIRYWENEFWTRPSLTDDCRGVEREEQSMMSLGRAVLLARYGDYVGMFWEWVKAEVKKHGTQDDRIYFGNKLVSQAKAALTDEKAHWEVIAEKLKHESVGWNSPGEIDPSKVPVSLMLYKIGKVHQMDFEPMKSLVFMYAERNATFHNDVARLIARGQVMQLGSLIQTDYHWAIENYPIQFPGERAAMMTWLQMKSKLWFNRLPGTPDGSDWIPTRQLAALVDKAQPKSKDERKAIGEARAAELVQNEDQEMAKGFANVVNANDKMKHFIVSRMFCDRPNELNPRSDLPAEHHDAARNAYEMSHQKLKQRNLLQRRLNQARRDAEKSKPVADERVASYVSQLAILDKSIEDEMPVDVGQRKSTMWNRIMHRKTELTQKTKDMRADMKGIIAGHIQILWETEQYYAQFGEDATRPLSPEKLSSPQKQSFPTGQRPVSQQPRGGSQQNRGGSQQARGGFQQTRGGFQQTRGGSQQDRGGFQQPQRSIRPPWDNSQRSQGR